MPNQKDILAHLRSYQDKMVELLEAFTNTDSPSTGKLYMDRFAGLVAGEWQSLGTDVTTLREEGYGDHVKVEWGSGRESILLLCHMDTVWDAGETQKSMLSRSPPGKAFSVFLLHPTQYPCGKEAGYSHALNRIWGPCES
ncbi:MAG TPA: M20 family metallopeptidase, partial [Firmicutes bacterium]|nr:M20 family metallopeptidase [Candidatus Fermentithermobacillaceae bacterium]